MPAVALYKTLKAAMALSPGVIMYSPETAPLASSTNKASNSFSLPEMNLTFLRSDGVKSNCQHSLLFSASDLPLVFGSKIHKELGV